MQLVKSWLSVTKLVNNVIDEVCKIEKLILGWTCHKILGKNPDLNQEPSEPQSDTLPIELHLPL